MATRRYVAIVDDQNLLFHSTDPGGDIIEALRRLALAKEEHGRDR